MKLGAPCGAAQKKKTTAHIRQWASTRLLVFSTFMVWKASFKNSEGKNNRGFKEPDMGCREYWRWLKYGLVWKCWILGWTKQVKSSGSAYQTWLQKPSVPSIQIFQPRLPRTMAQSHLTNRHVFGAWQCRGVVLLLRSSLFWWHICISSFGMSIQFGEMNHILYMHINIIYHIIYIYAYMYILYPMIPP